MQCYQRKYHSLQHKESNQYHLTKRLFNNQYMLQHYMLHIQQNNLYKHVYHDRNVKYQSTSHKQFQLLHMELYSLNTLCYQYMCYNLKCKGNNQSHPTKMLLRNQCRLLKYMPSIQQSKIHKHVQYYHNKKQYYIIHKYFQSLHRELHKLNMLYYQGKYYNLKHMENNQSHPTKMLLHNQCRLLKYMPSIQQNKLHKHVQYYHNKKYHCINHKQSQLMNMELYNLSMLCYQYKYYNQKCKENNYYHLAKMLFNNQCMLQQKYMLNIQQSSLCKRVYHCRNVKHQCISHKQFQLINKELCKLNMLCQSYKYHNLQHKESNQYHQANTSFRNQSIM